MAGPGQKAYDKQWREWNEDAGRVMAFYGYDEELAHMKEDELLERFVRAVQEGALVDPASVARLLVDKILSWPRMRYYS